jgi:hypothetical protein
LVQERPDVSRCESIARELRKPIGDFPITNKQWAIAPYLRLMLTGIPCSDPSLVYYNVVAAKLDVNNQLRLAANEKANSDMSDTSWKIEHHSQDVERTDSSL